MHKVTKEIKWSMAHRLRKGYEGACTNIHGHTYKALITLEAEELNGQDMALDFKEINQEIKEWIDRNWDHSLLIYEKDRTLIEFCVKEEIKHKLIKDNPTAEIMSAYLYNIAKNKLENGRIKVNSVTIYETDTSWATYKE